MQQKLIDLRAYVAEILNTEGGLYTKQELEQMASVSQSIMIARIKSANTQEKFMLTKRLLTKGEYDKQLLAAYMSQRDMDLLTARTIENSPHIMDFLVQVYSYRVAVIEPYLKDRKLPGDWLQHYARLDSTIDMLPIDGPSRLLTKRLAVCSNLRYVKENMQILPLTNLLKMTNLTIESLEEILADPHHISAEQVSLGPVLLCIAFGVGSIISLLTGMTNG